MIKADSQNFLHTALAEIKQHLGEADFNVDRLSRKLGLSRWQRHRHLRESGQPAQVNCCATCGTCRGFVAAAPPYNCEVAYRSDFRSPAYLRTVFAAFLAARPGSLRSRHKPNGLLQRPHAKTQRIRKIFLCGTFA